MGCRFTSIQARALSRASGYLPARIEGHGDNKSFTIRLQEDEGGEVKEVKYSVYKDARGVLKVNAPNIAPQNRRRR